MSKTTWYVRRGKNVKGPFPWDVIDRLQTRGKLRPADEVSTDLQRWIALSKASEDQIPATVRISGSPQTPDLPPADKISAPAGQPNQHLPTIKMDCSAFLERKKFASMAAYQIAREKARPNRSLLHVGVLIGALGMLLTMAINLTSAAPDNEADCDARPDPGVNWSNCLFEGADFNGLNLSGGKLRNVRLRGAKLVGTKFTAADLAYAELVQSDLSYANLIGVNLLGANLRSAELGHANLNGADLAYADLSSANIGGASFIDARLDHAIWIDGSVCLGDSRGHCRIDPCAKKGDSEISCSQLSVPEGMKAVGVSRDGEAPSTGT